MKRKRKSENPIRYDAQMPLNTEHDEPLDLINNEHKAKSMRFHDGQNDLPLDCSRSGTTAVSNESVHEVNEVLDLSVNKAKRNDTENSKDKVARTESGAPASPTIIDENVQRKHDISNWILNAVRQTQLNTILYSQMKMPPSISVG